MINIKLHADKQGRIIFKLKATKGEENNILLKRAIMESKVIKGKSRYTYEVPLRFFIPIFKNFDKEQIKLDKNSILSYLEFSDYYDENYYSEVESKAKYMKKWREEGCPDIYRITIDIDSYEVKKEVAFKKPKVRLMEKLQW